LNLPALFRGVTEEDICHGLGNPRQVPGRTHNVSEEADTQISAANPP
jgi:hypothetical protein